MKNIALFLALMMFGMNAYSVGNENVVYKEDGLSVVRCAPLETAASADSVRVPVTESELYEKFDMIADVTVISYKEVSINYNFMDTECVSYKTLVDVIPNNIYCTFDPESIYKYKFTVAIANSSYAFDSSYPEISVGKRYILFAENTHKLVNDSLKLRRYSDYFVSCPEGIAEINGNECTVNNIFSSYSENSKAVPADGQVPELLDGEALEVPIEFTSEKCSMPLEDFENTLNEKLTDVKKSRADKIAPEKMSALQYNACNANEALYNSFEFKNDYIYPDDFAGTFIDFDTLHVLVTDEAAVEKYRELLSDYSKYVTFDVVKYSYKELKKLTDKCAKELMDNNFSVTCWYVDVEENKGVIAVLSKEYGKVTAYTASRFDSDRIKIVNGEYGLLD